MDLVEEVHRLSASFPKAEIYGLTGQVRRAAVSIPSNIAEGHARASTKEYLNHVSIALGSLAEVPIQLEVALRLKYIAPGDLQPAMAEAAVLGKQLHSLRNALLEK